MTLPTKKTLPNSSGGHLDEWNWTIGQVVGVFGIVGEVKVRLETDFPERFLALTEACLRPARGKARVYEVRHSRLHKGQALLKFAGINSIEQAETLRGCTVQVKKAEAVALQDGDYYISDLIGAEVSTVDGKVLGNLEKVLVYPGHDLLQIGDVLIPAVKEMVVSIDLTAKKIVVNLPPGILPEEEPETAE